MVRLVLKPYVPADARRRFLPLLPRICFRSKGCCDRAVVCCRYQTKSRGENCVAAASLLLMSGCYARVSPCRLPAY